MYKLINILVVFFTIFIMTGCSNKDIEPATKNLPKPLRVGMTIHYPPLAFKYENRVIGLEVELANLLGLELNRPVQITVLPWIQLPQALQTGSVDIVMAGVSITDKRKKLMLFSKPYMKISQMAVMRLGTDTPDPFSKGKGKKIGFSDFTTGEKFVKETFPKADLIGYTKLEHGVVAVLNGEIDYFFHDSPSVWYYTANHSIDNLVGWYVPYTDEYLAWAFNRNNIEFKEIVDNILDKWKKNGTLQKVIHKWIPLDIHTVDNIKQVNFKY